MISPNRRSSGENYSFPKRVRWIETMLLHGFGDPRNLKVGEYTEFDTILVNDIASTLTFVLRRSDPNILTLSCIRNVIGREPLDDSCYIKLYISLHNFDERARRGIMSLHQNTIHLYYAIQFYRALDSPQYETLLKCTIRVVEMENTSNLQRERQEEELFLMTRVVFASPDQLSEMAYVLRRPDFGDVYTGRMDPSYASIMSGVIANACQYSRYIYEYIRARDRTDPIMPNIPLTEILSRICQPQYFDIQVCISLFTLAHKVGLEFLRVLCSAWLIENMSDNSVLYTIMIAAGAEDSELFQAAAEYFKGRQSIIISSVEWEWYMQMGEDCIQSVLRCIHYRSITGEWSFPPLPEKEVGEK